MQRFSSPPVQADAGSSVPEDSLRFTNCRYDPAIGKHFAQARFYDSGTGRMLAVDPVRRGLNGYPYCGNDPVDYVDPTGEVVNVIIGGVAGGLIGGAFGFVGSAASQLLSGEGFSLRKAAGTAANGAVVGAVRGAVLSSPAGVNPGVLAAADFVAGMAGNALEQKIVGGKVDWGESFTSGLNNAASGLIYGTNPFGSLKSAVGRSAGVGAATALRRKTLAGQCMQEDEPVPAGGKLRGRAWVPVCGAEDECAGPEKAESWV